MRRETMYLIIIYEYNLYTSVSIATARDATAAQCPLDGQPCAGDTTKHNDSKRFIDNSNMLKFSLRETKGWACRCSGNARWANKMRTCLCIRCLEANNLTILFHRGTTLLKKQWNPPSKKEKGGGGNLIHLSPRHKKACHIISIALLQSVAKLETQSTIKSNKEIA
jgi:hypothetical protein